MDDTFFSAASALLQLLQLLLDLPPAASAASPPAAPLAAPLAPRPTAHDDAQLVVLMIDGFRWDYAERMPPGDLAAFSMFREQGVRAEYVEPVFPSLSFSTWTSINTGLYPVSHGILGNNMYDPETGDYFGISQLDTDPVRDRKWWQDHIPIWTSAVDEGKCVSLYYWSECDVPFPSTRDPGRLLLPDKCVPCDNTNSVSFDTFPDILARGLADLANGTDAVFVYTSVVDSAGHAHGPDSTQLEDMVKRVDGAFYDFLKEIDTAKTNVVIVSDHGMMSYSKMSCVNVASYTDPSNILRTADSGGVMQLQLRPGVDVDRVLKDFADLPGVGAYKRGAFPANLAVGPHRFNLDILLVSEDGRAYVYFKPGEKRRRRRAAGGGATHGFNAMGSDLHSYATEGGYPDMRTIFYAAGPAFKRNHTHPWLKQVDEYQIFAHLLGIPGLPNNGSWDRVKDMFV